MSGLDLYKGNVPARYGGRAASVLDISLRNPDLNKFQMSGGVSFVANRLTVETPIVKGKLALLLPGKSKAYGLEVMVSGKKGELTGWVNYSYA